MGKEINKIIVKMNESVNEFRVGVQQANSDVLKLTTWPSSSTITSSVVVLTC